MDYTSSHSLDMRVSQVMKRVYVKMFLGLLATAFIALFVSYGGNQLSYTMAHGASNLYWVLAIVELGLVIGITAAINKISPVVATLLFYIFAVVNGFTLAVILQFYAPGAVAKTFFITAATFGAMSIYGYTTKSDLTRFGTFCVYALFGLIIAMLVNLFLKSQPLDWVISIIGVILFLGLTAWDTQKIKAAAAYAPDDSLSKLATLGALELYLDFINLFLFLLRFFGNRN